MLPPNKTKLWNRWLGGVPERDLAVMFGLRREDVELVLHEMATAPRQEIAA